MVLSKILGRLLFFSMMITALSAAPLYNLTKEEHQRLDQILSQYRCIVCQGQTLLEAENPVSHSIKNKIVALIQENKSDSEIDRYLVERYGDYIRFKPKLNVLNSVLWFGPFVAAGFILMAIRRRYYGQLTERSLHPT